jgi:sensor c-di-GMP phosphodiesterase-like protein
MPSTLSTSDKSAKQSRADSQSESETETSTSTEAAESTAAEDNTTAATDTELPPEQTVSVTAEGNWYFTLNDSVVRDLAMTVFQKDEDVYGAGKIREGNSTIDVAVSGTIVNSTMELNLISTNPIVQYKLNLDLGEDWASGEYEASTAGGETWTGIADGQKTS